MMVCDQCDEQLRDYVYCYECGDRVPRESAIYVPMLGAYVCPSCFEEKFITCAQCGEIIYYDDAQWDDMNEEYLCEDCYESRKGTEDEE